MQRLKINLNSSNSAYQIHNIKQESTEKGITKLQFDFMDLFLNNNKNKGIENVSRKVNLKKGAHIFQQKRNQTQLSPGPESNELKRLIDHEIFKRATDFVEVCFVSPAVITLKEHKAMKIALNS